MEWKLRNSIDILIFKDFKLIKYANFSQIIQAGCFTSYLVYWYLYITHFNTFTFVQRKQMLDSRIYGIMHIIYAMTNWPEVNCKRRKKVASAKPLFSKKVLKKASHWCEDKLQIMCLLISLEAKDETEFTRKAFIHT